MDQNTTIADLDRLRFENAQLSAIIRNLELQLFSLYAERDTDTKRTLTTPYQTNVHSEIAK